MTEDITFHPMKVCRNCYDSFFNSDWVFIGAIFNRMLNSYTCGLCGDKVKNQHGVYYADRDRSIIEAILE